MHSAFWFIVSLLVVTAFVLRWRIGNLDQVIDYFDTDAGRKIRNGIVTFVGLGILTGLLALAGQAKSQEWRYFEYGEVFLGLDYTLQDLSPQCAGEYVPVPIGEGAYRLSQVPVGTDGRLTSNGGFRLNLVQSPDHRFEVGAKYTHHSCALRTDTRLYDAVGLELSYRIW
jgi:hypothetical protein